MGEPAPQSNHEFYQGEEALVSPPQQRYMDTIATRAEHFGFGNYGPVVYGVYDATGETDILPEDFERVVYEMEFVDDVYRGERRESTLFKIQLKDSDGKNYLTMSGSLRPTQEDRQEPSAKSRKFHWNNVQHGTYNIGRLLLHGEEPTLDGDEATQDYLDKFINRPGINFQGLKDHESEILLVSHILDGLDRMHANGSLVPSEDASDPHNL